MSDKQNQEVKLTPSKMVQKKTLLTGVLFFSSCLVVSGSKVLADTGVFPNQSAEIPVTGYFLDEAEHRCNAGRKSFCRQIQHLTDRERQRIHRQEKSTLIPHFSPCRFQQSQLPSQLRSQQYLPCLRR